MITGPSCGDWRSGAPARVSASLHPERFLRRSRQAAPPITEPSNGAPLIGAIAGGAGGALQPSVTRRSYVTGQHHRSQRRATAGIRMSALRLFRAGPGGTRHTRARFGFEYARNLTDVALARILRSFRPGSYMSPPAPPPRNDGHAGACGPGRERTSQERRTLTKLNRWRLRSDRTCRSISHWPAPLARVSGTILDSGGAACRLALGDARHAH